MTTSAKTEAAKTSKTAPKATAAKEAPKTAPKATEKPKAAPAAAEAPKVQPETAAPAAEEKTVPAPEAPAAESAPDADQPLKLGDILAEMIFGIPGDAKLEGNEESDAVREFSESVRNSIFNGALPEGVAFAPEGFGLDFFPEDEAIFCAGPCGVEEVSPEEVFNAGVAEGLSRANHPAYGFGARQAAPAPMEPIQVVDQTTASFGHLVELQKLHVAGILTDAEYNNKKQDILRRIY